MNLDELLEEFNEDQGNWSPSRNSTLQNGKHPPQVAYDWGDTSFN